jgi:hypothetical protein
MKITLLTSFCILLTLAGYGAPPDAKRSDEMTRVETMTSDQGLVLKGSDRLVTPDSFRPPVEITIVAKTDSTNLRMAYAADQVIFNWEVNRDQLRVDGGPAGGHHTDGVGKIPRGKYVTIRWLVTPEHQAIYVDDELRFEHCGDYAGIDKPVSVFPAQGSKVTVKSIIVKQLVMRHDSRAPVFFEGMVK